MSSTTGTTSTRTREPGWGTVVIATVATFGVLVSSAIVAVVSAGFLQWGPTYPRIIDNGIPILVLFGGMVLCGRVAVDISGRRGVFAALGTSLVVLALGMAVSRSSEAHGDGIEPVQVVYAAVIVLVVVGGSAAVVQRRRTW